MARASAPRSAQAFAALGGRQDDASSARRVAALDGESLDRAAARYLGGASRARAERDAHRRQDAGQLSLSRPRRPHAARRENHSLRPRSSRHRPVDLHLPLSRRARICARSWRPRLVHRPARQADGALEVRAAEPDPDRQALRLGRAISTATLERVLAHLELPPDANCARFYESESRVRTVSRAQVREPVNARGLGRWKAYASRARAPHRRTRAGRQSRRLGTGRRLVIPAADLTALPLQTDGRRRDHDRPCVAASILARIWRRLCHDTIGPTSGIVHSRGEARCTPDLLG